MYEEVRLLQEELDVIIRIFEDQQQVYSKGVTAAREPEAEPGHSYQQTDRDTSARYDQALYDSEIFRQRGRNSDDKLYTGAQRGQQQSDLHLHHCDCSLPPSQRGVFDLRHEHKRLQEDGQLFMALLGHRCPSDFCGACSLLNPGQNEVPFQVEAAFREGVAEVLSEGLGKGTCRSKGAG